MSETLVFTVSMLLYISDYRGVLKLINEMTTQQKAEAFKSKNRQGSPFWTEFFFECCSCPYDTFAELVRQDPEFGRALATPTDNGTLPLHYLALYCCDVEVAAFVLIHSEPWSLHFCAEWRYSRQTPLAVS